jgi:hypothetical protein
MDFGGRRARHLAAAAIQNFAPHHQKGDEAYFGTNPGAYTSTAATGVASL